VVLTGFAFAQGQAGAPPAMTDTKKEPERKKPEVEIESEAARERAAPVALEDVDSLDPQRPIGHGLHLRLFRQAQQRQRELERREKAVVRKIKRLETIQADVQTRFKSLRMLQEELVALASEDEEDRGDADAERRREEEERIRKKRVRKLAAEFNKMKADEAAKVVEQMDEDLSVEILLMLKDRQAAKLLGKLDPKRAATLSEKMAQTKKKKRGKRR
jgi:flagellar motility protein MotE (MotC chaperone)